MLPDGSLADRVVLVTGGGTGLGRAMALELGRLGAKVAVLGRRREPLEETIAQLGGKGFAAPADVREPEASPLRSMRPSLRSDRSPRSSTTQPGTSTCTRRSFRRTGGVPSSASCSTGPFTAHGSSVDA